MASKVVMIRTVGGEYIIGTKNEDADNVQPTIFQANKIKLNDVRILNIQRTMQGAAMIFMPLFPFSQKVIKELDTIEIDKSSILIEVDESYIDGEIINGYKSNISGIDMSAAKPSVVV